MKGYLIAETDELGRVEWVWVYRETEKVLKPIERSGFRLTELGDFKVHGAGQVEVANWLKRGAQELR